jgi:soluble lytic murein transglycosylase-like protein
MGMKRLSPRSLALIAVTAAMTVASPAVAETARRTAAESYRYQREIAEASARYAVPARLIRAVIVAESGFDRHAVSRTGACGLMQLMPETAAILGVRDPFDARQNIHGGTRHLRAMMVRFRSDLPLAIAAYNAGEKAVASHGGVPPYPETREYVARVLRLYGAPMEWERFEGSGIHRLFQPDGTVVYTNMPVGRVSRASLE